MSRDFSILVATSRRASALRTLLTSIAGSGADLRRGEIVIVQNPADCDTASVVESFATSLPIQSLVETCRGQSRALNAGVQRCRGDLVLLTDDDAILAAGWVDAYLEAFARHPDAAYFFGPIEPLFAAAPSERWLRHAPPSHAGRDLGAHEWSASRALKRHDLIGVNAAVPRALLARFPFDECLGPGVPSAPLGADVQLGRRLLTSGKSAYWVPDARVRHCIGAERTTIRYLFDRRRNVGRSCVRYDRSAVPATLLATLAAVMVSVARCLRGIVTGGATAELLELAKLLGAAEAQMRWPR